MNIFTTKLFSTILVLGMALSLQGCDDEDIARGVGLVAIGAGTAIIVDGAHDRGHRRRGRVYCRAGYVTRCTTYVDYWGRYRRQCFQEWDRCAYTVRRYSQGPVLASTSTSSDDIVPVTAGLWAQEFKMSRESAEEFLAAMERAEQGNIQALVDLGLNDRDIKRLANKRLPTFSGTKALAHSLDMDKANARKMIRALHQKGRELNENNRL